MLTRTTRLQVLAFAIVAIVGIFYLAVNYVGAGRWFGASGYTVKVNLAQSGGLFSNAEVTYRGVSIGRVGDMNLTKDGIQVDLNIDSDDDIPADVTAVVANRSVIGEQYVDLQPKRDDGPYLRNGVTIAQRNTRLPLPVEDFLLSTDRFAASVDTGSLRTVVDEFYDATQDSGRQLQSLINTSKSFFSAAQDSLPETIDLIQTSQTVLKTQQNDSAAIKQFSANLNLIGAQLRDSNGDISKILTTAQPALAEANGLIDDVKGSARLLLGDLVTTAGVFLDNRNGLREVLVKLPQAVTAGGSVVTPNGVNVGLTPTFFDPLPCTAGYGGTKQRSGTNTSGNPALNTKASCTAPIGSGINIRGSQNAPGSK